jgi:hypothetical protein
VKVLARICTSCDLAALDVHHVAGDGVLVEVVHCRLCDGRRCRACLTPATEASQAMAICHYCAGPIAPLASAA